MEKNQELEKMIDIKKHQEIFYDKLIKLHKDINITKNGVSRCANCGDFCMFLATEKYDKMKLYKANFCGNRFCPTCAKRKSLKDMVALECMTKWIIEEKKRRFIFLTLTVPNVCADALDNKIREMNYAFDKFVRRHMFKSRAKGYVKKLELTYNKKANTYHPHFHILIAVSSRYFVDENQYLTRDKWLNEWQIVMNDTDISQVDIRTFKNKDGKEQKAILELTKYIAKDSDYMKTDDAFITFYNTLYRKCAFTFGGEFKQARKLYLNKELLKYLKIDETIWYWLITFGWVCGTYKERMKERYNNSNIDKNQLDDELFEDIL